MVHDMPTEENDDKSGQTPTHNKIVIIGAGLPRTGTTSTHVALQILLGGRCYHMKHCFMEDDRVQHHRFWIGLHEGTIPNSPKSFHDFFDKRDFIAGIDYPISLYYKTLMDAYPNAKVLLTVRDPETWVESVRQTVGRWHFAAQGIPFRMYNWLTGGQTADKMTQVVCQSMVDACAHADIKVGIRFYEEWIREVRQTVPKDRLFIFSVKQGWKPLCEFLDVPIPAQEFPHVNDKMAMRARFEKTRNMAWLLTVVVAASFTAGLAIAYKSIMWYNT